jgi:hypothetical protein
VVSRTDFTAEQLAEFHARGCEIKLGYEDCVTLGMALCSERDYILEYLTEHSDECDCGGCGALRSRLLTARETLDTLTGKVKVTWPELCREAEIQDFSQHSPPAGHG